MFDLEVHVSLPQCCKILFLTPNVSSIFVGNLGLKKWCICSILDRNKYHSRGLILGLFSFENSSDNHLSLAYDLFLLLFYLLLLNLLGRHWFQVVGFMVLCFIVLILPF